MTRVALTIAGSDPSGGAGIQADLKTFHRFGVYGEAVITLITVQNTRTVSRVECLDPALVAEQIQAVISDIAPHAAKLGALGGKTVVAAVAELAGAFNFPLVVDPVMISKHGAPLMAEDARRAMLERIVPVAFLLTPNLHEAEALTGEPVSDLAGMKRAAELLRRAGARNVLVKGGHLIGAATDVLFAEGQFHEFTAERFDTPHTHGTGCTYSSAITAELAKGTPLVEAVGIAKQFIARAIQTHPGLGHGAGPVNHHA
ncbi:MAG TPA: bifunctional hydroxymethylpyrimidine kinase/phosphomethylpyrimidine kinase [Bryobacteraceae bacterium]|nr:bifunctional hydroxymethylpyrimidine kinase/phosphomethylpyrimidine kinase [Bryobacteraceae bacterium]